MLSCRRRFVCVYFDERFVYDAIKTFIFHVFFSSLHTNSRKEFHWNTMYTPKMHILAYNIGLCVFGEKKSKTKPEIAEKAS